VIEVDQEGRMIGFEEKPRHPKHIPGDPTQALVSMGNYIFETEALYRELKRDAAEENSSHDFGKDIIPSLFPRAPVYVYDYSTNVIPGEKPNVYWRDVGTLDSYWQAHMDLVADDAPSLSTIASGRCTPITRPCPPPPSSIPTTARSRSPTP
jgi:glucose-1-phosphate adenylyltransferase